MARGGRRRGSAIRTTGSRRSSRDRKQLKTFNVGATGSLKLANVAGDVTVTGGSSSEIRIEAMPHGKGKTEAEAQQQLDTVKVEMRQSATASTSRPSTSRTAAPGSTTP